jgi:hypothetical protein
MSRTDDPRETQAYDPTCFDPTHAHLTSSCEVQDAAAAVIHVPPMPADLPAQPDTEDVPGELAWVAEWARGRRDVREPQIAELRQALWDVYRILGFDTDGDEQPPPDSAISPRLIDLVTAAAHEYREQHEDDYGQMERERDAARAEVQTRDTENARLKAALAKFEETT